MLQENVTSFCNDDHHNDHQEEDKDRNKGKGKGKGRNDDNDEDLDLMAGSLLTEIENALGMGLTLGIIPFVPSVPFVPTITDNK